MANLRSDRNTAQRAGTAYRGATDRSAFTFAEDVKHSEPVPDTTDNDSDNWRKHHSDAIAVASESVKDAHEELAQITQIEHGTEFVNSLPTDRSADAGWSITGLETGDLEAIHASYTFPAVSNSGATTFTADANTNVVPMLAITPGENADRFRIVHMRGDDEIATYPSDGQHWEFSWTNFISLRFYRLESDISDAAIVVGARLGDVFQLQKTTRVAKLVVPLSALDGDVTGLINQALHQNDALRTEVQNLEHKTSRIGSDIQGGPWAETTDNANGLRLGQAFYRGDSGTTTFFLDTLIWNTFMTPRKVTISGEFDNVLIGFIASNNSTWRDVRMVIRDNNGGIVTTYSPQNGRSAPDEAYNTIRGVPAALGDYTIRYMTTPDGGIDLVPALRNNWTITVEERDSTDIPVWEGELDSAVEHELEDLQKITADLHAGTVIATWADATQNSQGGIAISAKDTAWTLARARALANNGFSLNPSGGFTDVFVLVRVPHGTERAAARIEVDYHNDIGARVYNEGLNHLHFLGSSSDNNWDYYTDPDIFEGIAAVQLQVTENEAHAGTSSFAGHVTGVIDSEATGDKLLPNFPAAGSRNALVPKFSGNRLAYHPPIGEQEELASRSSLTGGWTIPDVDRLGGRNVIAQSGTTLRIATDAAFRSNTYGIIITIENTLGTSKSFIPWAMFLTGSGSYVTGGGRGTQGIPVGYWNANNNSEVVAHADWAEENGWFELTLAGPTRTGVATIRVWGAG